MQRLVRVLVAVIFLSSCGGNGGSTSPNPNPNPNPNPIPQNESVTQATQFFPLALTDKRQFRSYGHNSEQYSYDVFYSTIEKILVFNNAYVYSQVDYVRDSEIAHGPHNYFAKWDDGIYSLGSDFDYDPSTGLQTTITYNPAFKFLNSSFNTGDTWSTSLVATVEGLGGLQNVDIEKRVTVVAIEDITTSAGLIFSSCYKLSVQTLDRASPQNLLDSVELWLADGVGIVKQNINYGDGWIANWELQQASVGTANHGQEIAVELANVNDDFNDGILDPSWRYDLEWASDWNYVESNSSLTVSGITPINNTEIPVVVLQQYVTPRNDFDLTFNFSWSATDASAVQSVHLQLHDIKGNEILWAAYTDNLNTAYGGQVAHIWGTPETHFDSNSPLAASDSASINVTRSGSLINIYWNNMLILSGNDTRPVALVEISFNHANNGGTISAQSISFN